MAQPQHAEPLAMEKLSKLPPRAKVVKRPIARPAIASSYAGADKEKIIYISTKTPFMSAVSRAKKLLAQIDKREMQAVLDSKRRKQNDLSAQHDIKSEPVILKATGKAIRKALSLGLFFQKLPEYSIMIQTSSVDAIDDIDLDDADDDLGEDTPESRIRHTSVVEIYIRAQSR